MTLFRRDRVRERRPSSPSSRPASRPVTPPTPSTPPREEAESISTPPPPPRPEPTPPVTAPRPSAPGFPRDAAAVIDKKTQLSGTLHSEGNVLIEGAFEGQIEAKETILVEKDAQARGELRANNVIISGSFDGQIVCQNRFRVTPTGSIKGEINTSILVIEEGSTVNCRFVMSRERR